MWHLQFHLRIQGTMKDNANSLYCLEVSWNSLSNNTKINFSFRELEFFLDRLWPWGGALASMFYNLGYIIQTKCSELVSIKKRRNNGSKSFFFIKESKSECWFYLRIKERNSNCFRFNCHINKHAIRILPNKCDCN